MRPGRACPDPVGRSSENRSTRPTAPPPPPPQRRERPAARRGKGRPAHRHRLWPTSSTTTESPATQQHVSSPAQANTSIAACQTPPTTSRRRAPARDSAPPPSAGCGRSACCRSADGLSTGSSVRSLQRGGMRMLAVDKPIAVVVAGRAPLGSSRSGEPADHAVPALESCLRAGGQLACPTRAVLILASARPDRQRRRRPRRRLRPRRRQRRPRRHHRDRARPQPTLRRQRRRRQVRPRRQLPQGGRRRRRRLPAGPGHGPAAAARYAHTGDARAGALRRPEREAQDRAAGAPAAGRARLQAGHPQARLLSHGAARARHLPESPCGTRAGARDEGELRVSRGRR